MGTHESHKLKIMPTRKVQNTLEEVKMLRLIYLIHDKKVVASFKCVSRGFSGYQKNVISRGAKLQGSKIHWQAWLIGADTPPKWDRPPTITPGHRCNTESR